MENQINLFMSEMSKKLQESARRQGHSLEFVQGAMDWLLNKTRAKLTEEQRIQHLMELSTYPKWKILKLDEFTGYFSEVWDWLDKLPSPPVDNYESPREDQGYTKQLPDQKDYSKLERECGAKLFHGLSEILLGPPLPKGVGKQRISELHSQLREEYPMFAHSLKC